MFSALNLTPDIYSPTFFIDTLVGTKKHMTNKIIIHPDLNKAAIDFINAQAVFAKMMINNYVTINKVFVDTMSTYWFPKRSEPTK
jgi:hypothetical protein